MSTIFDLSDEQEETSINLDDLYEKQQQAAIRKLNLYNKMLAKIHNKIKIVSRQQNNDQHCWFQVPLFLLGSPEYDFNICINYVFDKLKDNGFFVKLINPNILLISWKGWIPAYARQEIKEKLGKKIDGTGKIIEEKKEEASQETTSADNKYKKIDTNPMKQNVYDEYFIKKLNGGGSNS